MESRKSNDFKIEIGLALVAAHKEIRKSKKGKLLGTREIYIHAYLLCGCFFLYDG